MSTNLPRRRLGFGALGATLIGSGAAAQGTPRERKRQLPWTFAPIPVVGGTPGLSPIGAFHVFGGPGQEQSTIGNFKGSSGAASLSGTVTRTNRKTGEQQSLPFAGLTDMRFMAGTFVGADGQEHQGTFALVWIEVFLPGSGGAQIHELNPSQFPPVGLFWTVPLPANGVEVDLANGTATMKAVKVPIYDYGTLQNALSMGNNPPPVPGWMSFKVIWQGGTASMPVSSTDPTKGIFSGTFASCMAQMEWQAQAGDFSFESDPLETSQSTFAEIGSEMNGSYLTSWTFAAARNT